MTKLRFEQLANRLLLCVLVAAATAAFYLPVEMRLSQYAEYAGVRHWVLMKAFSLASVFIGMGGLAGSGVKVFNRLRQENTELLRSAVRQLLDCVVVTVIGFSVYVYTGSAFGWAPYQSEFCQRM